MSMPSTSTLPRRRSRLWFGLLCLVIVIAVLAALVLDVPFLRSTSLPLLNGASTAGAADDAPFGNGGLNFADVVIADLTQEEEYNGRLESVRGTGTIIPAAQIPLAFDTAGTVADVLVQVGQAVLAGDVLARLDATGLERAITQAEIALRQAQIALEVAQEPPTAAQIQTAQDAVDQAAAALHLQQINHEATLNSTLVTQSLHDAQQNYDARLEEYNTWLEKYNNDEAAYWFVDQAQQALEDAEVALTSVELAVQQATTSSGNTLAQAADQYNQAKAALDALLAGASPSAVEDLALQVQAASLNLETAQENLANATLIAPFDGVVTDVGVVAGQDVGGGTPVVSLADLAQPTLEVFLGETNLDKVAVGTEVAARFSALPAESFSGSIVQIDPQLSAANGSLSLLRVLVRVDNPQGYRLPAGLSASVNVMGAGKRLARVFLPLNDEGMLAVGDPVSVELPDFSLIPGTVVFVPQTPTASASGAASFEVLVEIDEAGTVDEATAATLAALPDETSVDVIYVSDAATDVMVMPVSALVALLEGGYAVEKRTGPNQVQLVAVDVGFFGSNNMIAVTSDSLQPGDQVVVP
ncbi:MAG: HlyD family efflux transporter periplasmic adaptor subunit [Anaerolineae bacterium]|nr:HlyD family efflux transporter periplasmic adaptor subunit [Anaerolineae bacterium]